MPPEPPPSAAALPASTMDKRWRLGPLDGFDVIFLVLMLVTYAVLALLPLSPRRLGDGDFHMEAKTLAAFLRGAASWQDLALTRAPAPSLWYTIPYLLVSPGSADDRYWTFGFVWTAGWIAVSLLLIRRTAERMAGPLAGKLAALLVLASPFAAHYTFTILAEPVAYVAIALLAYGWVRWRDEAATERARIWSARLAHFGIVLLVLARPNAGLLIGVASGVAFLFWRQGTGEGKRQAAFALRGAAYGMIAILAMMVVGRALPGRADNQRQGELLSHILFQGRFQFRAEPFDWRPYDSSCNLGQTDSLNWKHLSDEFKQRGAGTGISHSDYRNEWVIADLKAHPMLALRQVASRAIYGQLTLVNSVKPESFHLGPLAGLPAYVLVHIAINAVNVLLLAGSLWTMWMYRGRLLPLWPFWGVYLALFLFPVLTYMEARYLFPLRVLLAILCGIALERPVRSIATRFHHV